MVDFVLASANIPFSIALVLMLIIGLFEGVGSLLGLGIGNVLDSIVPELNVTPDLEITETGSVNSLSRLLGWLRIGKVPILILLVVFLTAIGLVGYGLNLFSSRVFGFMLPILLSFPLAFLAALPVTRVGAMALEAIIPRDESSSVSLETLVGREAVILLGKASASSPAEAKVQDQHGKTHYIMVLAEEGGEDLISGLPLLLVRRQGSQFIAIKADGTERNNISL